VIYVAGVFGWVVAFAMFAFSRWLWISLFALVVLGLGQTLAGTMTTTLLQTRVTEHMRGRVMSLNTLVIMGLRPLGDFPAGALIGAIGAPAAVALSASLMGLYGMLLVTRRSIQTA